MAEDAVRETMRGLVNEITPTGAADYLQKIDPRPMWQALQAYFGVGQPQQGRPAYNPNAPESVRRQQLQGMQQGMLDQPMPGPVPMPSPMPPAFAPVPMPSPASPGVIDPDFYVQPMPRTLRQELEQITPPAGMPIPPNALDKLREQGPAYRGRPRKK